MAKFKRTPPNKPKPEKCEAQGCNEKPTCVLGGYWFCAEHGNRDYEKPNKPLHPRGVASAEPRSGESDGST